MDTLNLYNDITKAADEATRKTAELIGKTKLLGESIKAMGSVAFHGALGPGLFLFDPLEKFVKGQQTAKKAAEEFVITAKQTQFGGELAARGIDKAGQALLNSSSKASKSATYIADTLRAWTNTSKMMEDSIVALSGKTGMLATSFSTMAKGIQIATGPLATALLVTSTVYTQFVAKWMDESDKLEMKMKTLSATFKAAGGMFDVGSLNRMSGRYIAGGGTRAEFQGMMERAGGYGNISAQSASQTIEIARVIARTTGEDQAKVLGRYLESVAVLSATKSADEVAKTLRQYRVLAGPMDQQGYRGPLDRYASWRQGVGQGLNKWSDQYIDIVPRMMFQAGYMPQQRPSEVVGPAIGKALRYLGEGSLNLFGKMPITPHGTISGALGGATGPQMKDVWSWISKKVEEAPDRMGAVNRAEAQKEMAVIEKILKQKYENKPYGTQEQAERLDIILRNPHLSDEERIAQAGKFLTGGATRPVALTPERREVYARRLQNLQIGGLKGVTAGLDEQARPLLREVTQLQQGLDKMENELEAREMIEKGGGSFENVQERVKKMLVAYQKIEQEPENRLKYVDEINTLTKDMSKEQVAAMQRFKVMGLNSPEEVDKWFATPQSVLVHNRDATKKLLEQKAAEYEKIQTTADAVRSQARYVSPEMATPGIATMNMREVTELIRNHEKARANIEKQIVELQKQPLGERPMGAMTLLKGQLLQKQKEETGLTDEKDIKAFYGLMASQRFQDADELLTKKATGKVSSPLPIAYSRQRQLQSNALQALPAEQEKLEQRQFISGLAQYRYAGLLSAKESTGIEQTTKDWGPMGVAQGSIELAKLAGERQLKIQAATQLAQHNIGIGIGGIEAGIAGRRGMAGPETALLTSESGIVREQATRVWDIKKEMMDKELQFTIQYAQARANIIKVHYDNINQMERGRLQQMDLKYGPQIRYGQEVYSAQQGMVGAAMGRYTGEDYWRGQYRGARGLREQGVDLVMGMSGMQIPPELQAARALRGLREQRQDFVRNQARQREQDTRSIGGAETAWRATGQAVHAYGGNMRDFEASEGGRALQLQVLQQNQAAYSRQGIDVSGQIIGLQGKQQAFAGRKLATEMGIRGREGRSIEAQIADMRKTIGDAPLDTESRQKAGVELAEKYAEASKHFMSVGDLGKAKQYSDKQENILKDVPEILKRDFGDAQKKSLRQLEVHTNLLTGIAITLGAEIKTDKTTGIQKIGNTMISVMDAANKALRVVVVGKGGGKGDSKKEPGSLVEQAEAYANLSEEEKKLMRPQSGTIPTYMKTALTHSRALSYGSPKYQQKIRDAYWAEREKDIKDIPAGKADMRQIPGGGMAAFGGVGFSVVPTTKYVPGLYSDDPEMTKTREDAISQGQAEGEELGSKYNYREGLLDPKEESRKYLIKKYGVNKYMDYLDSQAPKAKYDRLAEMGGVMGGPNKETLARDDKIWGRDPTTHSVFDSEVTSSPDSEWAKKTPEDKMKGAGDIMLEAAKTLEKGADKIVNAKWEVTGPPGSTVTPSGAGNYPT